MADILDPARIGRAGWLALFPWLPGGKRNARGDRLDRRYYRYTSVLNLITGKPHSHARENARRRRQALREAA